MKMAQPAEVHKEIEQLIAQNRYTEIAEHPEAGRLEKGVSLIKLGKYNEALKVLPNNSFEKAYCYYKLEKYKSALKTAKNKKGEKWTVIRMQIYYGLDQYTEAWKEAETLKKTEYTLVNYAAILALGSLQNSMLKDKAQELLDTLSTQEKNKELKAEIEYNLAFAKLPDRAAMKQALENIQDKEAEEGHRNLVKAQIHTLAGEISEINPSTLGSKNRAIHRYNKEKITTPALEHTLRAFQREQYYAGLIRQHQKYKNAPELSEALECYQENSQPLDRVLSRMTRKNIVHLRQVLEKNKRSHHKVINHLSRILKHSK
ncbi:hypothetical protein NEOKW01_1746 [Nematocida sp. AWRm80]|nr:hypothetical protein NEOKW01_1746 [Nematocida sp. AWRm80]